VRGAEREEFPVDTRERTEYRGWRGLHSIDGTTKALAAQTALAFGAQAFECRRCSGDAVNHAETARNRKEPRPRPQLQRKT